MKQTTPNFRRYRTHDHLFVGAQRLLERLSAHVPSLKSNVASPAAMLDEPTLSAKELKKSQGLMRVNHSGEVCAQALYIGQSLTARSDSIKQTLTQAAQEEVAHLHWCHTRLQELNSRTSFLNPLWFTGSLCIGIGAGLFGDKWSLGFLAETENQVYQHLSSHLEKLPKQDLKSRAIVKQMRDDEAKHALTAYELGGVHFKTPIKIGMKMSAKVMTSLSYYI